MNSHIVSFLVSNHPGVLYRITGLFRRRGYNIDSITVGVTTDPKFSRITIVLHADDRLLEQIVNQLKKLIDVKKVKILKQEDSVLREMALVKVKLNQEERVKIMETVETLSGRVVDIGVETFMVQFYGSYEVINNAISTLEPFGIVEVARTGMVAVQRGDDTINDQ
ncbi:MAG TPA: acetolactate synthase small subunit [Clostridiales bacterium]|nr:acetolactate synthase small subunit [Clostridiales bacterium]